MLVWPATLAHMLVWACHPGAHAGVGLPPWRTRWGGPATLVQMLAWIRSLSDERRGCLGGRAEFDPERRGCLGCRAEVDPVNATQSTRPSQVESVDGQLTDPPALVSFFRSVASCHPAGAFAMTVSLVGARQAVAAACASVRAQVWGRSMRAGVGSVHACRCGVGPCAHVWSPSMRAGVGSVHALTCGVSPCTLAEPRLTDSVSNERLPCLSHCLVEGQVFEYSPCACSSTIDVHMEVF
eukprot:366103-Chlamydomonas_euryale.AAC.4